MAKKYIDADLLKKEIESLKSLEYPCDNSEQNLGFENALDRVSDIIDSLQQEQPSEDLEEAAEKFVYDWAGLSPTERRIAGRAYLAGAEWQKSEDDKETAELLAIAHLQGMEQQKEQMLKDAVEGLICATITGTDAISFLSPLPKELTAGDKVKIIIVKEDKE